jgi:putative ATP-binding cassette transporter
MKNQTDKSTTWKIVWSLIVPYWRSDEKWRARGLLAVIIVLTLSMVYMDVMFNAWNRDFYNAIENKNYPEFKAQLWRFSYLAFISISLFTYQYYLIQSLQMRWRTWMTERYLQDWLAKLSYYKIEQSRLTDNPDQRIAEDLKSLAISTIDLSIKLLSAVVSFAMFVGILWAISGPFTFSISGYQIKIDAYMVWFAIAYSLTGSIAIWAIGRTLVGLNYSQQKYEADFRFGLIRVRGFSEAIALYRGELEENAQLVSRFERIRANWWSIMRTTKRLNIASSFYGQFAIIFPMLAAAPRYFSGAITLGVLMQINSAFKHVQEALSWFIDAFNTQTSSLAEWKASVNRLAGFHAVVTARQSQKDTLKVERNNVGAILIDRLSLQLPNGQALAHPLTIDLQAGQRILVSGPSGCGKSTLFRAIAGIWSYGSGTIEIPMEFKLLFLPQKSYLPIGSLRAAVCYPAALNVYKELAIKHYFELCQIKHLIPLLEEIDDWSQRLSPGEQQRISFVRVLLTRPDVLFLDEATSALDSETEEHLYNLILQELPEVALISIAHRETVAKYHQVRWQFVRKHNREDGLDELASDAICTIEMSKIGKAPRATATTV